MRDLRDPIGLFFFLVGMILFIRWNETAPLTTIPVNFYAGVTMILFGLVMVWLARKRS
jgi:hypothetical protein